MNSPQRPDLPPELLDHWRKIASPANVAVAASSGRWQPAWHLLAMNKAIVDALVSPEQTFLNFQVSVRGGKSYITSVWSTVWELGLFPNRKILIVCATGDLAEKFSREARDIFREWGPILFNKKVRDDMSSVSEWGTDDGGVVRAVGRGGMITGYGFDTIKIDDPIADSKEAKSETIKQNLIEWYSGTLRTRLEPGGTMILCMARWSDDDLSATLAEKAVQTGAGDPWKIIKIGALAECPPDEDPAEWTDEWGRKDGESFWEEKWPAHVLAQIRESLLDPTAWDALYQQEPVAQTGNMFEKGHWRWVDLNDLDIIDRVRAWDIAASDGKGDWTVGALLGRTRDRRTVVLDVIRGRWTPDRVEEQVLNAAERDGMDVRIRMETPKGDAGVTALHYANLLHHRDFDGWPVKGKKDERAALMSGSQKKGRLCLPLNQPWTEDLVNELSRFPKGRHDDQVDACSLAFNQLWESGGDTTIGIPEGLVTLNGMSPDVDGTVVWSGALPQPAGLNLVG